MIDCEIVDCEFCSAPTPDRKVLFAYVIKFSLALVAFMFVIGTPNSHLAAKSENRRARVKPISSSYVQDTLYNLPSRPDFVSNKVEIEKLSRIGGMSIMALNAPLRSNNSSGEILDYVAEESFNLTGPMRGLYVWHGQPGAETKVRPADAYARFMWYVLEPEAGRYDFSMIDAELTKLPAGGSFSFRVMALNSFLNRNDGVGIPGDLVEACPKGFDVPIAALTGSGPKKIYVPDWNCSVFLDRLEALLDALGARYNGDPRIGYIDIGIYGNWGEWHLAGLPPRIVPYTRADINLRGALPGTSVSRRRIIDAYLHAFPQTQLVMMTDDKEALVYALKQPAQIPVGIRRDSFGTEHFDKSFIAGIREKKDQELILDRWKFAPIVVETYNDLIHRDNSWDLMPPQVSKWHISSIGNGGFGPGGNGDWSVVNERQRENFLTAAALAGYNFQFHVKGISYYSNGVSISISFKNIGVAPTYLDWIVDYLFCRIDDGDACPKRITSKVSLRGILPVKSFDRSEGFTDNVVLKLSQSDPDLKMFLYVRDSRDPSRRMLLRSGPIRKNGYQDMGTTIFPYMAQ